MTLEVALLNETLHLIEAVMFLANYVSNQTEEAMIRPFELGKSVLFIYLFLRYQDLQHMLCLPLSNLLPFP